MPATDEEWKKKLTPEQYKIMRQKGTEAPFTSPLVDNHQTGMFKCAGCGQELFSSDTKFDSGTGWPSFDQAIAGSVIMRPDNEYGMERTEVVCSRCGAHLGHLFDDGPATTGKRFCINGACLLMEPKE